MPSSSVVEVFRRATRLALRVGASEVDIDILMVTLDFEGGLAQPIDLSKIDALLTRYRRADVESPELSGRESSGSGYNSEWIGLSSEVRAAVAPFEGFETVTIDSLRAALLAAKKQED